MDIFLLSFSNTNSPSIFLLFISNIFFILEFFLLFQIVIPFPFGDVEVI